MASSSERSVRIFISKPFWSTWWFIALSILIVCAAAAFVYRRESLRIRRERTIQRRFSHLQIESQEAERKRIAAELHDGLGQNLLLASNELQYYLRNGNGSREELQQAEQLIEESIHTVREMSSYLHPHQLDRLGFTSALEAMTDTISRSSGIEFVQQVESIDGFLTKEAEMQVYRIIQESLSNVVKHAQAARVTIEIWRGPRRIDVVIADDGKGFDPQLVYANGSNGPGGFGMSSMSERARMLKGSWSVSSAPGKGTTIFLNVPCG